MTPSLSYTENTKRTENDMHPKSVLARGTIVFGPFYLFKSAVRFHGRKSMHFVACRNNVHSETEHVFDDNVANL